MFYYPTAADQLGDITGMWNYERNTSAIGWHEIDEKESDLSMKSLLPAELASNDMDMVFALISIEQRGISLTYLVPSDESAAKV